MAAKGAKKKNQPNNAQRIEVHAEDFIPYACHYDPYTILTKNGELMQVIKLTGFTFESVHKSDTERLLLRSALRKAILENIKTNNFALYFHTIRRKHDLSTGGSYPNSFSNELNESWCNRNDWSNKYINELYVTIIIEGESFALTDVKRMFRAIAYNKELFHRMRYLEEKAQDLHDVVKKIMSYLTEYGARLLQVHQHEDGIYYSDISGFLSKILNLKYEPIPLAATDLSLMLPSHKVSFGYNALEVKGDTGRHFAAMLTIKEYHEISSAAVDELLQIPQEFIVTESFDFVSNKKGLDDFKKQQTFMEISADKFLAEVSGLNDILESATDSPVDFGEHQISVMVFEDTLPLLERGVDLAITAMQHIGVVAFREDLLMEDCYWAQLPANFVFNKRMTTINASHMGGYASLYNFPAGKIDNNHWGPAVTVFYTAAKTPYFFNFHYGDNGHMLIVGPFGSGKTILMNFLISEAMKFKPKIFFFDYQRGSEIFLRAAEGNYYTFNSASRESTTMRLNPLKLPDTSKNRKFLREWMAYLLVDSLSELSEHDSKKIEQAIEFSYTLDSRTRNLSSVLPKFWSIQPKEKESTTPQKPNLTESEEIISEEIDISTMAIHAGETLTMEEIIAASEAKKAKAAEVAVEVASHDLSAEAEADQRKTPEERASLWYGEGECAHLFDNEEELLDLSTNSVFGFDITQILDDGKAHTLIVLYLLHLIESSLDGSPTIIVLDEAWEVMDKPALNYNISEWLDRLRKKNAMVIFSSEHIQQAEESSMSKILADKIETKIFLPNIDADIEGYEGIFGLSSNEFQMLRSMDIGRRQFLLKHNIDAVVAELNLAGMFYECSVLSSTIDHLSLMHLSITETSDDPDDWLPSFKQKILKT